MYACPCMPCGVRVPSPRGHRSPPRRHTVYTTRKTTHPLGRISETSFSRTWGAGTHNEEKGFGKISSHLSIHTCVTLGVYYTLRCRGNLEFAREGCSLLRVISHHTVHSNQAIRMDCVRDTAAVVVVLKKTDPVRNKEVLVGTDIIGK